MTTFQLEIHNLQGSESAGITLSAETPLEALELAAAPPETDWEVDLYDADTDLWRGLKVRASSVHGALRAAADTIRT